MITTPEVKEKAAEICERYKPAEGARRLLQPALMPKEFLKLLDAHHLFADGLRFAAYALPQREAIWWGCLCAWSIYRPKPPEKIEEVLTTVLRWVQEPNEERRRAAGVLMDKTGVETPAGGLAAAVFLGGENIAPPKLPEVKPKPFVWAKVLAGAVIQAAKEVPRDKKKSCERQFLKIALDILESRTRWEPVASWREVIVRRDGR